jgi:hypothetical protein
VIPIRIAGMLAVALGALAGCGYSMQSSLDPRYQSIHIPSFRNESREYDLQAPLTNAVVRKFLNDGRLRVTGENAADLIVDGTITGYELGGLTFDRNDEITQFRLTVHARVRVYDARTGDVLWSDDDVVGDTSFGSALTGAESDRLRGNAEAFLPVVRSFATPQENQAAAEALEGLASEVFFRTIEPW